MIDGPQKNGFEQKVFSLELATPDDWEVVKTTRQKALMEEPEIFGTTPEILEGEASVGEDKWRGFLSRPNLFVVLAREGSDIVGMGHAQKFSDGLGNFDPENWSLSLAFVEKKFRKKGIGRKILEMRINEIKKRGGKRIFAGIRKDNKPMMELALSLGFKEANKVPDEMQAKLDKMFASFETKMELDLSSIGK